MNKDKKIIKKYYLTFLVLCMFSIFILSVDSTNSNDIYSDELKITVTNFDQTNFQPGESGGGWRRRGDSSVDTFRVSSFDRLCVQIEIRWSFATVRRGIGFLSGGRRGGNEGEVS